MIERKLYTYLKTALLRKVHLRHNVSFSSSASVDMVFSYTTYMNSPRKNALRDDLFEKLKFFRGNKYLNTA